MANNQTQATWNYHDGTKHPGGHLMNPHHRYDPIFNPVPYKIYEKLDSIPLSLSVDDRLTSMPALSAIATHISPVPEGKVPDISIITRILHFSAGITKKLQTGVGEMPFRAAACTGALYHIELYLVCGDLPGLNAGVYHFDPSESALRLLRKGDYRRTLIDAAANEPAVANAPAVLVYTDIFSRNAVKYQAREYRHAFWDSGTIIANTLATAAASSLSANVVIGFVDDSVNQLLSLDDRREVALALVPIGYVPAIVTGATPEIGPLEATTVHGSDFDEDFPAIREMHQASSLTSWAEVAEWRAKPSTIKTTEPSAPLIPLEHQSPGTLPMDPVEKVITRRGSTREFSQYPVSFSQLSTILESASRKLPADFLTSQGDSLTELYLIINEVDGVRSGSYAYGRDGHTLELIREGEFRHDAGQLALGQALGADASVNLYFMARLEPIVERLGNRGYRAAQLEASVTAGRVYLAAYALGLGATGLTFRDDAVTGFLSPHAKDKSAMFLVAVGKKVRRI